MRKRQKGMTLLPDATGRWQLQPENSYGGL
jgi:hypothetical protein